MKRWLFTLAAMMAAAAGGYVAARREPVPERVAAAGPSKPTAVLAAAGRVEPAGEEIRIGSEIDGRLRSVPVEEGQELRAGAVIAVIDAGLDQARVATAQAAIQERRAALERLMAGSRAEEKRESEAAVREVQALLDTARIEFDRRHGLVDRGAVARTELDAARRDVRSLEARLQAARERAAVVAAGPRAEEVEQLRAEIRQAEARLSEAQAAVAKTVIRAPAAGRVLRKHLKAGESVSADGQTPVITMGDMRVLRVRADVDESDVGRLSVGQLAYVTAPAYGNRRFTGKVARVGQILGRKRIRTDEPVERVDQKILETLIDLDPGQFLPAGLRVDAFIEAGARP